MSTQAIQLADLHRLADAEAPDLGTAIQAFVDQGEPDREEALPDDAMTLPMLRAALQQAARQWDKKQRQSQAHEAWKRYLAQPDDRVAPQMRLAELVVALYEKKTPAARGALLLLAREAPLVFGLWGGLKRVFKRAEKDLDVEIFGALAARFDAAAGHGATGDVGKGTLVYLRRRGWRFLRQLGKASPELYPQAAVEILRSYPTGTAQYSTWIATHVFSHAAKKWGGVKKLPREKKFRAPYLEAWQRSPDPLMLLLETCSADMAASFAILGLRELFPEALRKVTPEWLGRLAYRPLPSAHDFLVETLEGSPDFHQGKLATIGLKEPVLRLLVSPSQKARKYAIEYARGHAADMPTERLVELLDEASSYRDTVQFVVSLLTARPARSLGVRMLGRLIKHEAASKWAKNALETEFDKKELDEDFLVDMLFDDDSDTSEWIQGYIKKKLKPTELTVAFWMRVLDDPRLEDNYTDVDELSFELLEKHPIASVPGDWLLAGLARDDIGWRVSEWLEKADKLPPSLDLERIKGLVFDPAKRQVAFTLLGNPKLVSPGDVGVGWLLALARRADPALHEWAHKYLLQHLKPEHFADGKADAAKGVTRLFQLASGAKEPEAVRAFAQTYLRCHHPKIGKQQAETKQYGVKPSIPREAYSDERVWPCLWDTRPDVRRFGVAIARVELRRWGALGRVYELAESNAKEVRNLAYDAMVQAGDPHADPESTLRPEELDAAQIFSMTESRKRSSRDVAMDLIRKHYARLGGAERLAWLMQSADREVRLFAVRLLWEKHRPRGVPASWQPQKGKLEDAGPFQDAEALRALLRRLLFMVPPVRSMEQLDTARAKKLPASAAKRHVIDVVRDLGVKDAGFAQLVAPVLGEFTGSMAKGEWQACLSALVTLRAAHGLAVEGLV